jgi:16S rRNA (uracil1498-N3)-methyltransferase
VATDAGHDEVDGRGGPHVFADDLDHLELTEPDRHHLERVLRLRAGDALTVSDGAGSWRACRFGVELEPVGAVQHVVAPAPPITIGFALVKGERPELIVQKLTELGVDRIVPFVAERSVVRWDPDRAGRHVERLRRVSREAAMQSRRCWLPEVSATLDFDGAVRAGPSPVALAERGGDPPSLAVTTVLVGPEGGWTGNERALVTGRVALGAHVLRVETAAIAGATVLAALRSELVKPAEPLG